MRRWQSKTEAPDHPVIFDSLDSLSDERKCEEAMDVLVAGADTTASILTTAVLNILNNPDVQRKLVSALDAEIPADEDMPSLSSLERIQYLVRLPSPCLSPELSADSCVAWLYKGGTETGYGRARTPTTNRTWWQR